tara:strand:+ start:46 stop:417 length:372 start_codon:yes stop_codon:yes gene_type:complete
MSTSPVKTTNTTDIQNELKADHALGLVSLGLMQRLSNEGNSGLNWLLEANHKKADLISLRNRLELTALALETGAPLSTTEITLLLGVKPNKSKIERGGLIARKISRNVWKLNKIEKDQSYWRN